MLDSAGLVCIWLLAVPVTGTAMIAIGLYGLLAVVPKLQIGNGPRADLYAVRACHAAVLGGIVTLFLWILSILGVGVLAALKQAGING